MHAAVPSSQPDQAEVPAGGVGPRAPRTLLVGVGVLLLGAVAAVDPGGLVPYGPLRWLVVTAGLLGAVAGLRGPLALPRATALGWLALLAALGLGAVLAADPLHAWVGTPDRRLGWLSWVGFAMAWAAGVALGRAGRERWLVRALVLGGLVATGGAVLSAVGVLPDDGVSGRVGGLAGSPSYLAALLVLLVPVSAGLAADTTEPRPWRCLAGVAATGGGVALAATLTRGAWLGLAVATLAVATLAVPLPWRRTRDQNPLPACGIDAQRGSSAASPTSIPRRNRRSGAHAAQGWRRFHAFWASIPRRGRGWGGGLVLAVGVLAVGLVLLTPVGARVVDVGSPDGTARGRLDEWAVAVRVVAADPLTGVGPEGYRIAFPAHVDEGYAHAHGRDVVVDRAHSSVLDVAAAGGIPAAVAWLVLLGTILRTVRRAAGRTARAGPLAAGVTVAVVAYAVQQLVLFPLAEVDPVWWLLVGLVTAWAPPDRALVVHRTAVVRGVALLGLGLVLAMGTAGVLADRDMAAASRLAGTDPAAAAIRAADAAARRPDDIRLAFAAARIAEQVHGLAGADQALDHLAAGLARSPADPVLLAAQADLLAERAARSRLPADGEAALAAAEALVTRDPTNAARWAGLGRAHLLLGDRPAAVEALRRAEDLDPDARGVAALAARLTLDQPPPADRTVDDQDDSS